VNAVNYNHREGTTKVDFRGTDLVPKAKGTAEVKSQTGSTKVETHVEHLPPANTFGPEFLTYVLWAITPEGRASNLGELALDGDHANLLSTSDLQAFGLIVTAEPYFAVTQPSDVVVMENFIRKDTVGTIQPIEVRYELLQRGTYTLSRSNVKLPPIDSKGPLQLWEARNAVRIATLAGAEQYAPETMTKATTDLLNAEQFMRHEPNPERKRAETNAREAAQMAEDARIIAIKKIQEEQLASERAAAAAREAEARQVAEQEAAQRRQAELQTQQAEAQRAAAVQARADAERAKREADEAAQKALAAKSEADAARQAALAQQQNLQAEAEKARAAAADAERQRAQAETEKAELRSRLLQQLNVILETRDTARGLIVNMSDVLFDTGKYTLKPEARERLAKVAGVVLAYPGLKLEIEGHTDSVGSDGYNQTLSENRAAAVRDFLAQQGVSSANMTAKGFGKTRPIASNDTAAGRQRNRRVELVVSGDAIGIPVVPTGQ
jgi:outer membrane protein OmpA-like peptidoglycan-associated protein